MSATFVLAPAALSAGSSQGVPQDATASLNLLPFSLGSSSRPYTSTNAHISSHFQPRPAPVGIIGVPEGKPIASFRGRQLVGQHVKVPRGYTGWLLRTDSLEKARLAMGMGSGVPVNKQVDQYTETAESSRDGQSSSRITRSGGREQAQAEEEDDLSLKRSPRKNGIAGLKQRVRGAGQIALARPKRAVAKAVKKRLRLDSDDEDEEEGMPAPPSVTPKKRPGAPLTTPTRQSPRLAKTPRTANGDAIQLPDITLHEATPLKSPLPPAPAHLKLKKGGARDFVIGRSALSRDEEDDEEVVLEKEVQGKEGIKAEAEGDELEETDTEGPSGVSSATPSMAASALSIIPSPATENDPPAFPIESAAPSPVAEEHKPDVIPDEYEVKITDVDGPVRVLRPTSTFSGFTLWTADTALAGYVDPGSTGSTVPKGVHAISEEAQDTATTEVKDGGDETGPKIRSGWWAAGGAGEGGDGIVRALGEFVGLLEMVHEPIYMTQLAQDEEDEEDD